MNYQVKYKVSIRLKKLKIIGVTMTMFNYGEVCLSRSICPKENLSELLSMAITDFEPNEAAAIVLDYKLSDSLNEGQIQQISNDMLIDKISEEYPEIAMQAPLYHINQLLLKRTMENFQMRKLPLWNFQ
jgi:hypothetical protein